MSSSTVRTLDRPPVCVLSAPLSVACGGPKTRIAFDASASVDPDDPAAPLAFRWTSSCAQANWFYPSPGHAVLEVDGCDFVCEIELTVTSGQLSSRCQANVAILPPSSELRAHATRDNGAPICDAGPAQIVECSQFGFVEVGLDGGGSRDPEGEPLSFSWSADLSGASFDDPTDPTPKLRIPTASGCSRVVTVRLEVSDGGLRSQCTTTVEVLAPNDVPNGLPADIGGRVLTAPGTALIGARAEPFAGGSAAGAPFVLWRIPVEGRVVSRLVPGALHVVACDRAFAIPAALVRERTSESLGFPWSLPGADSTGEAALYFFLDREASARLSLCTEALALCAATDCAHSPSTSPIDKRSTSSPSSW